MNNLKNIFDNAVKQTVDSTYTWFDYPSNEQIEKQKEKSKPTIGDNIKEISTKVKKAIADTSSVIDPDTLMNTYNQTLSSLTSKRMRLPGRVETGGTIIPKMAGKVQGMPRPETFTDKINEVRARMRAFATDRYFSDITAKS